jgi:hypothetical protein
MHSSYLMWSKKKVYQIKLRLNGKWHIVKSVNDNISREREYIGEK